MKKLFLSSGIIIVSAFGGNAFAFSDSANTLSNVEFADTIEAIRTTSIAKNMHNGDFQVQARTISADRLYNGTGAALMAVTRRFR